MSASQKKQQLGQFMTTNYEYILQNMHIPENVKTIVEPFCGNGDLLKFINDDSIDIETYDIDPQIEGTIERDTLKNPPSYTDKFVLTNPPYLARNKSKDKKIFDQYGTNDLYKCFILSIIHDQPNGGIMIIPLNFLCSIRSADIDLRRLFLQKFRIMYVNIFEQKVFNDTSYTVCTIQFQKIDTYESHMIPISIYPSKKQINVELTEQNQYMIGGEMYNLPVNPKVSITRLTKSNKNLIHTNILVKCIDDNHANQIKLEYVGDDRIYIDETSNQSARTYATLVIDPPLSEIEQRNLVDRFNEYLYEKRQMYHSLFLTNYRESKDIARKRISFSLVYSICGYLLLEDNSIDLESLSI